MKQGQYAPLPVEKQILAIYAATSGCLDGIPASAVQRYERELFTFVEAKHAATLTLLREKKELTDDVKAKVDGVLADFAKVFSV